MDGVVLAPSLFSKTTGSPPSITAMQELVVPKSIPKTLAICVQSSETLSSDCSIYSKRIVNSFLIRDYQWNGNSAHLIERAKLTRNFRTEADRCVSSSPCLV